MDGVWTHTQQMLCGCTVTRSGHRGTRLVEHHVTALRMCDGHRRVESSWGVSPFDLDALSVLVEQSVITVCG